MKVRRLVLITDDRNTVSLSWKEAHELLSWLQAHSADIVMTDEGGPGNMARAEALAMSGRKPEVDSGQA